VAARDYGQYGGVARALELVGERWALLIVRDLLVGPRRYGELAAGLPRIPSNILATRLKELQAAGVLRRAPHSRIIVYELTPYGHELEPVVLALGAWGAVQASGAGLAIALGGVLHDTIAAIAPSTTFGAALAYDFVYALEILLLITTLVLMIPLIRRNAAYA